MDRNTTAKTTTFKEPDGTVIDLSWFFHKITGKISFLIRKDILASDEASVAVIGHEMFELELLRSVFEAGAPVEKMGGGNEPIHPREFPLASLGLRGSIGRRHEWRGDMIRGLIAMYESGSITGYQLMMDCLHRLDPNKPDLVLAELPVEILEERLAYARRYDPCLPRSATLIPPAEDQVRTAERWISARNAMSSGPVNP